MSLLILVLQKLDLHSFFHICPALYPNTKVCLIPSSPVIPAYPMNHPKPLSSLLLIPEEMLPSPENMPHTALQCLLLSLSDLNVLQKVHGVLHTSHSFLSATSSLPSIVFLLQISQLKKLRLKYYMQFQLCK